MSKKISYPLTGYYTDSKGVRTDSPVRLNNSREAAEFISGRTETGSCLITDMEDQPILIINGKWVTHFYSKALCKEFLGELSKSQISDQYFEGENKNEVL